MRAVLRAILGDPDGRAPEEITRDIDDEVNFHLSEIERELRESGRDPDNARAEARRRFGDPAVYRRACRDVALKERIMLQRINLALLVIVMIALGATAWQSWSSQRRTAEAVERLSERIGALGATSGVAREPAEQRSTTIAALPEGAAFVGGSVGRPGAYAIPHDGLSVRRLLVMAGAPERDFDVRIEPSSPVIGNEPRTMTAQDMAEGRDHLVIRGDLVTVTARPRTNPGGSSATPPQPPRPDAHGRLTELSFSPQVLARLASLKDECFARYEAAAAGLSLDSLVLRSETVLVVGEVDRPGIYHLGSVKQRGSKLTFADLLSAAGGSQRVQSVEYHSRKRTGVIPAAETFGPADVPADAIVLARVDAPGPDFNANSVILFNDEGEWRPLANLFSPEAHATLERLRAHDWSQWPNESGAAVAGPNAGGRPQSGVARNAITFSIQGGRLIVFLTSFADRDAPALTPKRLLQVGDHLTRMSLGVPFTAMPPSWRSTMRLSIQAPSAPSPRLLSFAEASASEEIIPPGSSVSFVPSRGVPLPR